MAECSAIGHSAPGAFRKSASVLVRPTDIHTRLSITCREACGAKAHEHILI